MEQSRPAKMLLLVFRDSLEDDLVALLKTLEVKAFTEVHKVEGIGETGSAYASLASPGNSMILAVLDDAHADRVVKGVREFRNQCTRHQHGAKVPLRVFVLPCLEAV